MKGVLSTLLAILLFCAASFAQNGYSVFPIPYNPDPFTGGIPANVVADDTFSSKIPLPFSFCFYDQSYDTLVIGDNGMITFDLSKADEKCWYSFSPMPCYYTFTRAVMGPYTDLDPSQGGQISYNVHGTAPNRRFVVSYYQVPPFVTQIVTHTGQIVLHETSNIIETHFQDKPLGTHSGGAPSQHAIYVDLGASYVVPGRNATLWTATNDGYLFLPLGTCSVPPSTSDAILGRAFLDYNRNCVQDPGELPIVNRPIVANGGQFYGWTNPDGDFVLGVTSGTHVIEQFNPSPYIFPNNHCLPGGTYNITVSGFTVSGVDFPDSVGVLGPDLSVDFGTIPLRRCSYVPSTLTYYNNGTASDTNVTLTLTLVDSLTLISSTPSATPQGNNVYTFNIGTLSPGQFGVVTMVLHVGCDPGGTTYCVTSSISGAAPFDCDIYNNSGVDCYQVVAPVDPNEKLVAAQNGSGFVLTDEIDKDDILSYQINFQNVGSSYAEDVEIRDTIDVSRLRLETFQAGAGSAPYNYVIIGNVVVFRFEDIMLPDSTTDEVGSHGFVKFSIEQQPGNLPGTMINNRASIYFDYEAPVHTNHTTNYIAFPNSLNPGVAEIAEVYPNPGKEHLVIDRDVDENWMFSLHDLSGRVLLQVPISEMRSVVVTSGLNPGLYYYRLTQGERLLQVGKWVKE